MKLIHTSDWHLGARLHEEDRAAEHKAFLEWLLGQIQEEKPDALLVSGDVFDSAAPSASAMKLYHEFVVRAIHEAGCPHVIVTGGNHDSPSWLGMSKPALECLGASVVPAGEEEVEKECVVVERDGHVALVVAAIPYLRESELANLVRREDETRTHDELVRAGYAEHCRRVVAAAREKAGPAPVVMMGHCVLSGSTLSDDVSERQRGVSKNVTVGGVKSVDFDALPAVDYLALGHLHVPQKVAGRDVARYSGSPIPQKSSPASSSPSCSASKELAREARPVFVDVMVTKGEGDLSPWWAKFAALASEHPEIKILVERDRREKVAAGTGLEDIAAANDDLSTLDEMAIARARLREENLTDVDREAFEGMLAEVIQEVKADGAGN